MARYTKRTTAKDDSRPTLTCRDCVHSYGWYNQSFHDGHFIFCRCQFYKNGVFCKFLSDPQCANFVKRNNDKEAE